MKSKDSKQTRSVFSIVIAVFIAFSVGCGRATPPPSAAANVETFTGLYPNDTDSAGWSEPLQNQPVESVEEELQRLERESIINLQNTLRQNDNAFDVPLEEVNRPQEDETLDDASEDGTTTEETSEQNPPEANFIRTPENKKSTGGLFSPSRTKGITFGSSAPGAPSLTFNDTRSFVPASITKVFTTSLALETLGPDFRFETRVEWRDRAATDTSVATSVRIVGSGDPTFGRAGFDATSLSRIHQLAAEMYAKGVRRIEGPIKAQSIDSRWDNPVHPQGVEAGDLLACYGALSQAFNFRDNCTGLTITGINKAHWNDNAVEMPLYFDMAAGSRTGLAIRPRFNEQGSVIAYTIKGSWNSKRNRSVSVRIPVANVKDRFRNLFIDELKRVGIAYVPDASSGTGTGETNSARVFSAPLSRIIVPLLKHSDNFLADTLFKRLGTTWPDKNISLREAAQQRLAQAIEDWTREAGFPHMKNELLFLDGAGLSRQNRATPRAFLAVLKTIASKRYFQHLWHALPIAGVDGTLANRLKSAPIRGNVRAKTGTVRGSYQLAGYIPVRRTGRYVPFVILSATTPGNRFRVKTIHEQFLQRLVRAVNSSASNQQINLVNFTEISTNP